MKYRKLGSSYLEFSEISLVSWLTYGVGVEAAAARACLERAFEVGINFIDTANIYGRGAARGGLCRPPAHRICRGESRTLPLRCPSIRTS